jgi:hypothetical protein
MLALKVGDRVKVRRKDDGVEEVGLIYKETDRCFHYSLETGSGRFMISKSQRARRRSHRQVTHVWVNA